MSALEEITTERRGLVGAVTRLSERFGPVSRRGFFVSAAVAGSAMATDPKAYALRPQTAYATICGPGNTAASGWTVFCCTINKGVNACPPGSFAAGWWKAADSSWCGGGYRYIVDCNAQCTKCSSGCSGDHICDKGCWNCSCGTGSTATCDQRRVCCNAFRYGQCNTHVSCSGGVHCRVVSCVAPYKWTNCTTASLQDDRTREHSAPCLPSWTSITWKHAQMNDQASYLRASIGPQRWVGDGQGSYVLYQGGVIYAATGAGTHPMSNFVHGVWKQWSGPNGVLGYPVQDPANSADGGWAQVFERGAIVDSPNTTTSFVYANYWQTWAAHSREYGVLGFPTTHRFKTARGGTIQGFQGGAITYGPVTPVAAVYEPVASIWTRNGREGGTMGFPDGNRYNTVRGGWIQRFERGAVIDGPATPAVAVIEPAYSIWAAHKREWGLLGFPKQDRTAGAGGGWVQTFETGAIADGPDTAATAVYGVLYTGWAAAGRDAGALGYPTAAVVIESRGRHQVFVGGELWALGSGAARRVYGGVLTKWKLAGGAAGSYGYPITDTISSDGRLTCDFEGGTITA